MSKSQRENLSKVETAWHIAKEAAALRERALQENLEFLAYLLATIIAEAEIQVAKRTN